MKFKLAATSFWITIFLYLPMVFIGSIIPLYLVVLQSDYRFLFFLIAPLSLLLILTLHAKDYFSIVIIDEIGVKARLFGVTWFSASWNEKIYIAEFYLPSNRLFGNICFSKKPIKFTKSIFWGEIPWNARLKGMAMVMVATDKVKQEISQYVSLEKIDNLGRLKIRNLPKN